MNAREPRAGDRHRRLLTVAAAGGFVLGAVPAFARVLDAAAGTGTGTGTGTGAPAPTPRLTDGPFYPTAFAADPTPSLVVGTLRSEARALRLSGRVVDRGGRPLEGARIEIWQCDAQRRYHHPADGPAAGRDPGFLGHGWQATGLGGRYAFDTIRPVAYPGRTPHIHVKVKVGGRAVLSSQIFMPDEAAANARDGLWRSLAAEQALALATLERGAGSRDTARFDIVIG